MANVGRNVTASATITFHRLTPRNAVMASASTRDGNTAPGAFDGVGGDESAALEPSHRLIIRRDRHDGTAS